MLASHRMDTKIRNRSDMRDAERLKASPWQPLIEYRCAARQMAVYRGIGLNANVDAACAPARVEMF